jgi:cellulose synthase/poly-beta-1,6-N-acetylglucosamine synthase-like glycosyltransferase
MIDLLAIITWAISYILIYCSVYFFYIHYTKKEDVDTKYHPGVSIITSAYNEESNIKRLIESVINQDYGGDIELIVMDDGSTDNTGKITKSYPQVRYVRVTPPGKPQGKTKTINHGVKLAKHEIVGVLDADSYLHNKAIKNMAYEFKNPEVGSVVPITKVHNPKNLLERLQLIEYTLSMCVRKLTSNTNSLFMTHGVGTLFKKKALKEVGYFEENTLTEDLNIGLKLSKAGYKIKSNFKAIGYTVVPRKTKELIKQRLRWNGGLFENSYWFRDMFFKKKYGNLGLFILPINLAWSGITVFTVIRWLIKGIKGLYYGIKDLIITNMDWLYFIRNKLTISALIFNEMTVLSLISLVMFISFYYIMSKKVNLSMKESLISYLLLPFYFVILLAINAFATMLTPIYLLKKGGRPWLTDKTTQ